MSVIKAVIFDLGNVLIDFDYHLAVERISRFSDKNPDQIFEVFFDSQLTASFEAARILPDEFFLKVKDTLKLKMDYAEFLPIWNEIFFLSPENEQVYGLASTLKQNYSLALISNINVLHFDYIKRKFSVFDPFRVIVASCQVGACKPDPLIYQKTLSALGARPQDAFYTDDRPELVDSANRLGIRGFVFKGAKQLYQDLIACGVTINKNVP